jgi:hypothetical protein
LVQREDNMTQKTALILSVVLTAFLLVVGGAVIARVSQPEAAAVAAPADVAPSAAAGSAADASAAAAPAAPSNDLQAQVQEVMQQREEQYRQLLDEANQRLAAMNKQLAAAEMAQPVAAAPARVAAPAVPAPAPAQPAAPQITLSPESARDIAIQATNFATMIRTPELVRFEGKIAYEVGFTRGVVYVDANSGAVLFNGAQGGSKVQSNSQPPTSSGEHESEHEDEHETEHEGEHD